MLSEAFFDAKGTKHCNLQDFYAWQYQKYEQLTKNRPKNANKDVQTHLRILPSFFPPRTPKNEVGGTGAPPGSLATTTTRRGIAGYRMG